MTHDSISPVTMPPSGDLLFYFLGNLFTTRGGGGGRNTESDNDPSQRLLNNLNFVTFCTIIIWKK